LVELLAKHLTRSRRNHTGICWGIRPGGPCPNGLPVRGKGLNFVGDVSAFIWPKQGPVKPLVFLAGAPVRLPPQAPGTPHRTGKESMILTPCAASITLEEEGSPGLNL